MTYIDALNWLKTVPVHGAVYCDAKQKCMEALGKQIPKESIRRTDIVLTSNPPKYLWLCGTCGDDVGYDRQFKFCPICGQKIDWS